MKWGRALTFVGCLLLIHALLFLAYTTVVGQGHKTTRSDQVFAQGPDDIDLLILGDSHPRTALAPRLIGPRVVNAAVGGEHYLKTWYRMRTLLEGTGKRVDAILLPLDCNSFSSWHAENFAPEFVWGRYVDYLEIGRVRGEVWPYVTRWIKGRFFPYAGELRTLNQIRTRRFGFGEDLPNGNLAKREGDAFALQQAKEHFKGSEIVDPGLKWAFDNILQWSFEHDIQVVLVAFPLSRDYQFWAEKAGAPQRVRAEVIEPVLADGRAIFLDDASMFIEHDELFSDPHHVNVAGRTIFSRQIRQQLVERGILED